MVGDQRGGIRDKKGGICDHNPGIRDPSHGIGIARSLRAQAVPFLWDQAPKFVTLLESRIRNLGTKM